ncbi:MAG: hypothetical protein U9R21_00890, partial [Candidatus Thermoplasmatota archaeon]|nr:hypothetical protein [Candidatus Thermoplasmatota archaeon]
SITFTPEWLPLLDICADQSSVVTPPGETTNVSINIINAGNAWAIVEAEMDTELGGWISRISPCNVLIEVHEAEQMVLSLESPKDFNGTQPIELVFTPFHYSEIGPSYSISIELHYP